MPKQPQQTRPIQITKVKVNEERVHIEYKERQGTNVLVAELNSPEQPRPELRQALAALTNDVLDICSLPIGYEKDLVVKGISIDYGEESGELGLVIIASKKVPGSNSPFNINTPHQAEATEEKKKGLSKATIARVKAVLDEARLYLNGERAQLSLVTDAAKS